MYTLTFEDFWVAVLSEQVVDDGQKLMHKEFYEDFIFLIYYFYHVTLWDVLEWIPLELTPTVLPLGIPIVIDEEVVQVV